MPPNMNPFGPDHGSSRSQSDAGSSNNGRLAASEITFFDHIEIESITLHKLLSTTQITFRVAHFEFEPESPSSLRSGESGAQISAQSRTQFCIAVSSPSI